MTNDTFLAYLYGLKFKGIVYLKCLYLTNRLLYCTVYTGIYVYIHIKKLSLRAAVVVNQSITASMLGCQIGGFVAS